MFWNRGSGASAKPLKIALANWSGLPSGLRMISPHGVARSPTASALSRATRPNLSEPLEAYDRPFRTQQAQPLSRRIGFSGTSVKRPSAELQHVSIPDLFSMTRILFWLAVYVGRPFGGIRPRRIVHWLAQRAYGGTIPRDSDFRWYRDHWGSELLLHPHYFLDYQIMAFGEYEPSVHRLIERIVRPGMVCIDGGANIGSLTLHLASLVGQSGQVFAFEPMPHLASRLRKNIARSSAASSISVQQCALSRAVGACTLNAAPDTHPNQGMASLRNRNNAHLVSKIDVETTTLDKFVDSRALERLDLIKLDVQGAEPWVIEGGIRTLKRFSPDVITEISPTDLESFESSPSQLIRLFNAIGYDCFSFNDRGPTFLRTVGHRFEVAENIYCRRRVPGIRRDLIHSE